MKFDEVNPMRRIMPIVLLAVLVLFGSRSGGAQIIVIANPGVHADEISRSDLRDIFNGASSSIKNGARVEPVLLKDGAVHEEMLSLYLGKSDQAFRASWRSLLFSGEGVLPKTLGSESAVVEYVAHTSGAIGYIGKSAPHEGVKILAVK